MSITMTDHDEIRAWVSARAGSPALIDMPDGMGESDARLRLVFGQRATNAAGGEGPDRRGGVQMATWTEWFDVFEAEKFAFVVPDETDAIEQDAYSIEKRP